MTVENASEVAPSATLDTSGLLCPLPVYKAALALKAMEPGQVLELICTDPGSLADIPALNVRHSHHVQDHRSFCRSSQGPRHTRV